MGNGVGLHLVVCPQLLWLCLRLRPPPSSVMAIPLFIQQTRLNTQPIRVVSRWLELRPTANHTYALSTLSPNYRVSSEVRQLHSANIRRLFWGLARLVSAAPRAVRREFPVRKAWAIIDDSTRFAKLSSRAKPNHTRSYPVMSHAFAAAIVLRVHQYKQLDLTYFAATPTTNGTHNVDVDATPPLSSKAIPEALLAVVSCSCCAPSSNSVFLRDVFSYANVRCVALTERVTWQPNNIGVFPIAGSESRRLQLQAFCLRGTVPTTVVCLLSTPFA